MLKNIHVPILGFSAFSGTGKTTLLQQLIPLLKAQGLQIGVIKHAHHSFDIDKSGKDSYVLRKAGAQKTLIVSRQRWALMVETPQAREPRLDDILGKLDQSDLDIILVEGFKNEHIPKIELYRPSLGKPLMFPEDPNIIACASDAALNVQTDLPILDLNNPEEIGAFICRHYQSFEPMLTKRTAVIEDAPNSCP